MPKREKSEPYEIPVPERLPEMPVIPEEAPEIIPDENPPDTPAETPSETPAELPIPLKKSK